MSLETTARTEGAALGHLAARLTLEEKVALVVGAGTWETTGIERIGLRPMVLSDGPVGVRGGTGSPAATAAMFPAPSALAATWDLDLARRAGALFATEARRHGVDVVLAPQVNLQRTPVGGRHFECYSEDPVLTADVAVALVGAAQERGVGMCVKHYVANDSETDRTRYVARVDERTLREVYLAPFERLVADADAWSVMGAYSGVDDGHESAPALEHRGLLTGVLKDEWGFDGVVVSDWVATRSVAGAVRGGLDLQMPGPDGVWGDGLLEAVRSGEVAEGELDDKVERLLRLAVRVGALRLDGSAPEGPTSGASAVGHGTPEDAAALLRELTARSMVVLKDEAGLLPLASAARVALVGPGAVDLFLLGGGSSFVVPDRVTCVVDELRTAFPATEVSVHAGARPRRNPPLLDVAALCTDPVTGAVGVRVELLGVDGTVLEVEAGQPWDGWRQDVLADAATLRLTADVRLTEPGVHGLGLGTVGVHDVRVDGAPVASGETVADTGIVLSSGHNHPFAVVHEVTVGPDAPRTVRLAADLQVVHPVGYASFVRAELVHALPGPSAEDELSEAVEAARAADVAVVVVGTTEEVESEGYDRPDLALPGNQDELVARVLAANPRTVVVVNAGAPVLLPWLADAPTVLWAWLPGQEGGTALADVLAGVTEPSGRLPWTLPARAQDVPVPDAIPVDGVVDYAEGVHVGYRAWERDGLEPAAPFGHGLGWTTWSYDALEVAPGGDAAPDEPAGVVVTVTLTNTGPRAGREVVQAYVEPPAPDADRPRRWLGGFTTVDAAPGETVTARVPVRRRAFQIWDTGARRWATPPGDHAVRVGRSVRDLRLDAVASLTASPLELSPTTRSHGVSAPSNSARRHP
ncbi:glycoside hydrolase family 3 protein [Cellulomonas sp. PhB143]|uniref:beta-d-glucosidase n=1 Tax=Cellulomonas sp. PhB143 TaxID=2485186 RepID=UPI000F46860B|nr:glycoside hydrolase family 3 C-terminal domain-containing protein [Cellulomonas sp. PhB143]ROS76601.1 beta-glucosidase [Cellulomonas sp. PhB143]